MFESRPLAAASVAPAPIFRPQGIAFNGLTNMTFGSNFAGSVNGTKGTFSFWFQSTDPGTTSTVIFEAHPTTGAGSGLLIGHQGVTQGNVIGFNLATLLVALGSTAFLNGDPWRWVGCSWDVSVPVFQMYVNGVAETVTGGPPAVGTVKYAGDTNYNFASFNGFILPLKGNVAQVWYDETTFQDFTVLGNVQKFYNAGLPVDLGASGQNPTGTSPIMFLDGTLASPWSTNKGPGGGFTVSNGALSAVTGPP